MPVKMDFRIKNEDLRGKIEGNRKKFRIKMVVPQACIMAVKKERSRKKETLEFETKGILWRFHSCMRLSVAQNIYYAPGSCPCRPAGITLT